MRKLLLSLTILGIFALAFVPTARASATPMIYNFTSCEATSGVCNTGSPYGTVSLTQNGTSVDVTVTLNNGLEFVNTGAGGSPPQLFKFVGDTGSNSTSMPASDISVIGSYSNFGGSVTLTGNYYSSGIDGDGTGLFFFGITCTQNGSACSNGAPGAVAGPITFTVQNATIADLTVANSLGILFTADVINPTDGQTGPIDVSGGPVPEPASLLLLGLGLTGLGGISLRRRRRKATSES